MEAIRIVEAGELKKDRGGFAPGDTVKISVKVIEGEKERLQAFEGVVIRKRGEGVGASFTVRRISYGVGVERTFPLHSPRIDKIQVMKRAIVRRAKLYYLRELAGKAARLKERRYVQVPASGGATATPSETTQQRLGARIERPLPLRASCVATRPHARRRRGRGGAGPPGRTGGGRGGRADAGRPDQGVDDSKRLEPEVREDLYDAIRARAIAWAVGIVDPATIDRINILEATRVAMRAALGRSVSSPSSC